MKMIDYVIGVKGHNCSFLSELFQLVFIKGGFSSETLIELPLNLFNLLSKLKKEPFYIFSKLTWQIVNFYT